MKRKLWIRIGAVVLAALLLWWLFWAILIDEDENDQGLPETEQIEAVDYFPAFSYSFSEIFCIFAY